MILKTKSGLFLVLLITSFLLITCNKNDDFPIDTGYVNITIRPNSTEYIELNNVGGWVYLTADEPSRGIIVYRMTMDEFKAYERTPTYKPDSCCIYEPYIKLTKVIVEESGITALDTCSGTQYLLIDGSVIAGPAQYPLVPYNTDYDGEYLHIYN